MRVSHSASCAVRHEDFGVAVALGEPADFSQLVRREIAYTVS